MRHRYHFRDLLFIFKIGATVTSQRYYRSKTENRRHYFSFLDNGGVQLVRCEHHDADLLFNNYLCKP
jgi:hypothetical protein